MAESSRPPRLNAMGHEDARAGSRTRTRALIAISLAFVALIAIAALQGHPVFQSIDVSGQVIMPTETPAPGPTDSGLPDLEPREPNPWIAIIAAVIASAVGLTLAFLLIRLIVRVIRQWWHDRPLRRADGGTPDVGLTAAAPQERIEEAVVRHGIAGAIDAVASDLAPTDAITAAWVGLEDAARRAGQSRGAAETPGEFTLRIVGTRADSEDAVRALLALYESVRFGGRIAEESDRLRARALLEQIQEHWR